MAVRQKESILQTTMVSIIDAGNVSWVGSLPSGSEPSSWDQSVLCHDRDQYRYSRKGTALQPLLNIEGYGYELRTRVFYQLCGYHIESGDDGPQTRLGIWLNTNYSTMIFRNKIPAAVTGGKGDLSLTTTSFYAGSVRQAKSQAKYRSCYMNWQGSGVDLEIYPSKESWLHWFVVWLNLRHSGILQ